MTEQVVWWFQIDRRCCNQAGKTLDPPLAIIELRTSKGTFEIPVREQHRGTQCGWNPPPLTQGSPDSSVSSLVCVNLVLPELSVCLRHPETFRTAVPKAAIHEHRHLLLGKRKIWLSLNRVVPSPASYSVCSKQFHHSHLGALVSPTTDPRHDLGSFGFRDDVSHLHVDSMRPILRSGKP